MAKKTRDGANDVPFRAGEELELTQTLRLPTDEPALAKRLGQSARDPTTLSFGPRAHLDGLLNTYAIVR